MTTKIAAVYGNKVVGSEGIWSCQGSNTWILGGSYSFKFVGPFMASDGTQCYGQDAAGNWFKVWRYNAYQPCADPTTVVVVPPAPAPSPAPAPVPPPVVVGTRLPALVTLVKWSSVQRVDYDKPYFDKALVQVNDFFSRETYGKVAFDFVVTPMQTLAVDFPNPPADWYYYYNLGIAAAAKAGYTPANYQRNLVIFTETGNSGYRQAALGYGLIALRDTYQMNKLCHELGHTMGLMHAWDGNEYGSKYDIMGDSATITHFHAFHKFIMNALTPMVVTGPVDVVLRPLEVWPDALRKGMYWIEYHQNDTVMVVQQELHPTGSGGWDSKTLALLDAGQSFQDANIKVTSLGGGRVTVA